MKLLVFLPCLNEASTISEVINRIPRTFEGIEKVDVLVIDDGSTDRSNEVARSIGAEVIQNGFTRGVGYCMQRASQYAIQQGYSLLVNIDSDGQFAPEDIPDLLKPIIQNRADIVVGSRFKANPSTIQNMPWIKRWGNRQMANLVNRLVGHQFEDVSCGFRAYSKEALMRLNLYGAFTYTQESFLAAAFMGLRIEEVPVKVTYFKNRKSRVAGNLLTYTSNTLRIIFNTYRDYRPMRFFSTIATGFLVIGFCFLGFLASWYVAHHSFSPHIWAGFVGASFAFLGILVLIFAQVAEMNTRLRRNQEEMLYLIKKSVLDSSERR